MIAVNLENRTSPLVSHFIHTLKRKEKEDMLREASIVFFIQPSQLCGNAS